GVFQIPSSSRHAATSRWRFSTSRRSSATNLPTRPEAERTRRPRSRLAKIVKQRVLVWRPDVRRRGIPLAGDLMSLRDRYENQFASSEKLFLRAESVIPGGITH